MTTKQEIVLVLRTCNADLTAYGGFQWPESGEVSAPDLDRGIKLGYVGEDGIEPGVTYRLDEHDSFVAVKK